MRFFYHDRELWWCSLGINIGSEQNGKGAKYLRPVLILKKISPNTCLVVPLTTSPKEHTLRINIGKINGKNVKVIVTQIRVIDARRLVVKISTLNAVIFGVIRKTIRNLF